MNTSIARRPAVGALIAALLITAFDGGSTLAKTKRHNNLRVHPVTGTVVLGGNMSTSATLTMKGAFSVGHAADLLWTVPMATAVQQNGYSQDIDAISFRFDVPPDSARTVAGDGGAMLREFYWKSPPDNTVIHVTETLHATARTDLTPFHSNATYPLGVVPRAVAPYLKQTALTQVSDGTRVLLNHLQRHNATERAMVNAVANWVATYVHTVPAKSGGPIGATSVYKQLKGTPAGNVNLMAGLLRAVGIPVQVEFGWIAPGLMSVSVGSSAIPLQWSEPGPANGLHTWLNVWFPDAGWVPFDPRLEKFFVDAHHFAFIPTMDAANPGLGAWSWAHGSTLGAPVSGGAQVTYPGDAQIGKIQIAAQDDMNLTFRQLQKDLDNTVLLSR